jgi:hypothetical protein
MQRIRDLAQRGSETTAVDGFRSGPTKKKTKHHHWMPRAGFALILLTAGGSPMLSGTARAQQTTYYPIKNSKITTNEDTPPPNVQDCAVLNNASPREWACDGKTYNSFQLSKMREEWEKNHPGSRIMWW